MATTAPLKPSASPAPLKSKLTLAEAAERYEHARLAIDGLKPVMEEAAEVLKDHFERTGRASFKNRIGWRWSGGGLILDQAKVRDHLGDRLGEFQTRSRRSRSLTLLAP